MDTVHVFDVRVPGKQGPLHFDVMTTDQDQAMREPLVMISSEQQRQFREQGGFIITLPS